MIGHIGYATQSGLGVLSRAFYRHGVVDRFLMIPHGRYTNHADWYQEYYTRHNAEAFLAGLKALLVIENAFTAWNVVARAREQGIRVVLVPMYEWTPRSLPVRPDAVICPSALDVDYYRQYDPTLLTIPVDTPWRERREARVYVHNAGHGGHGAGGFRNGTSELVEAMQYVQSPLRLIVRGQPGSPQIEQLFERWDGHDPRIEFRLGDFPDEELYEEGDVFVFPEKFNGLSLPLQEAFAAGMLIMAGARFPMTEWLPRDPLIPVLRYERARIAVEFKKAVYEPWVIAKTMDAWYGREILGYSHAGKVWAEQHSWPALGQRWREAILG